MDRSIELSNKNCYIYVDDAIVKITGIISAKYYEGNGWLIEFFDDRGDYQHWLQSAEGGVLLQELPDDNII